MNTATIPPIKIDANIYERFKLHAKRKNKTISGLIRQFISKTVDAKKDSEKELNELLAKYSFSETDIVNDLPRLDSTNYKDIIYRELKK